MREREREGERERERKGRETVYLSIRCIFLFNNRFSGLTADNFKGVTTTLQDVQDKLLKIIYEDTILIGHSLESDLRSVKVYFVWSINSSFYHY